MSVSLSVTVNRRAAGVVGAAAVALACVLTSCDSSGERATSEASTSSGPSPVYGAPQSGPIPTDAPPSVATDPPSEASKESEATLQVTSAGYDTSAGAVVVRALLPERVEEDGTCTLTLTSGGAKATGSRPAVPDAQSTSCGAISVPAAELDSGRWEAVVTYTSPRTQAASDPVDVDVP